MGVESIVERILSDAEAECKAIVTDGEQKAAEILSAADCRAEKSRRETESEVAEKRKQILERKAATARLDASKIVLDGKRKVVDAIYACARKKLLDLPKDRSVALMEKLLTEYAETGDEIVFASGYAFEKEVLALPVVQERSLTVSKERANIDGGILLIGKISDKNLSFEALLASDRDAYQSAYSTELFQRD